MPGSEGDAAVDAYVQLALLEKARRVFSTGEGTFLSFPLLSPLTLSPRALEAIVAPASAADYAAAADFARIVNFIPRDMVATFDDDTYLWDIYSEVLTRAVSAIKGGDDVDEARHQAAQALLYRNETDGTTLESDAYRAYRQYRDAWFAAQENYNARRLTGEMSDDPATRQQWLEREEPALRAALAAAAADWEMLGRRSEIESALADEQVVGAADLPKRWGEWKASFNPDIDMIGDAGGRVAPTGFSPTDLSSDASWARFELSAAEIANLVADAPPPLRAALEDSRSDALKSIGFEYRSVAVNRPWFRSAALTSRIWRFGHGESPLCDGGDPPAGRCPAYVAALVLMRNLVQQKDAGTPVPLDWRGDFRFTLPIELLTKRAIAQPQMIERWQQKTVNLRDTQNVPLETPPPRTVLACRRVAAQGFENRATGLSIASQMRRREIAAPSVTRFETLAPVVVRSVPAQLRPWVVREPGFDQRATEQRSQPTPPPSGVVTVLAFICKRLPKMPDPLPDLRWV